MEMKLEREFTNMNDDEFIKEYEKLLQKGYCDCNEMNCIDNNAPYRILNIAQKTIAKNHELDSNNRLLVQELKDCKKENQKLRKRVEELDNAQSNVEQMTIGGV